MPDSITTPCVLFPDLFNRPLPATFDVPNASSDGGALLLKAADRRLGLIPRLAAALVDDRQPGKVRHALADLLGQLPPNKGDHRLEADVLVVPDLGLGGRQRRRATRR